MTELSIKQRTRMREQRRNYEGRKYMETVINQQVKKCQRSLPYSRMLPRISKIGGFVGLSVLPSVHHCMSVVPFRSVANQRFVRYEYLSVQLSHILSRILSHILSHILSRILSARNSVQSKTQSGRFVCQQVLLNTVLSVRNLSLVADKQRYRNPRLTCSRF